jgi:hypothetical protein
VRVACTNTHKGIEPSKTTKLQNAQGDPYVFAGMLVGEVVDTASVLSEDGAAGSGWATRRGREGQGTSSGGAAGS